MYLLYLSSKQPQYSCWNFSRIFKNFPKLWLSKMSLSPCSLYNLLYSGNNKLKEKHDYCLVLTKSIASISFLLTLWIGILKFFFKGCEQHNLWWITLCRRQSSASFLRPSRFIISKPISVLLYTNVLGLVNLCRDTFKISFVRFQPYLLFQLTQCLKLLTQAFTGIYFSDNFQTILFLK